MNFDDIFSKLKQKYPTSSIQQLIYDSVEFCIPTLIGKQFSSRNGSKMNTGGLRSIPDDLLLKYLNRYLNKK